MAGGFIYGYVVMLSLVIVVMLSVLREGSGSFSVVPAAVCDFGEQVYRIVVDDLTGDVYVAGDNVLYHLNSGLSLLQTITLDPTCRCNNSVKVLEIDPTFRRLLVCASSEKGECVFKDLKNITTSQPFKKEHIQEPGFVGYRIVVDDSEVPFVHFDQQSSIANSDTSRLVVVSPNTISANDQNSRSKPLLSVREIYNKGETFYMRYVTTKEGQLQMNKFNTRFQYYVIDKFCYNYTCYLITLQQANQGSHALVNRLGAVCTRSLYPYVELPLVFKKNDNGVENNSRVMAATVGKVGNGILGEIPLVVIVFGVASNSSARHADVTLGYSITVMTLEEVETFAAVAILQCDLGGLASPDWIDGTPNTCVKSSHQQHQAKCNSTEKMTVRQVQDEQLAVTAFIPGGNDTGDVVSVFTHTQVVDDNGTQRLDEAMIIYMLLSSGRVHIFRCSKSHDVPFKTTYLGSAMMYSETPADSWTWQVKADIAITGEFFYFLSATKVLKVPLDYCLNISTCEECLQTKGCFWCQSNETCELRSKNCFAETCPARIGNFWPKSGPTKGGTQLSLYFTESLSDNTTIEVCGQTCSEIRNQNERSLSCTVPSSENDSEAVCNIVVTLWSNPPTRISASGYQYINSGFQGFEPLKMIMSERGQMRLYGQHLDTGSRLAVILSSDKVNVNGDKLTCHVLERNKTSLLCELNTTHANSGNNSRVYCYGITLTIDNARLEPRSGKSFCRHPDPKLTQVYPLFTFASGGTQVTLEGTNLNTTGSPHLALSLPANETGEYKEEMSQYPCQPCPGAWNKTCLLCCLPVFPSLTSTNESLQVWFSFREERVGQTLARVVFNGSTPLTLSVLPDPQFVIADLHNQKCLPMGEQVTPLTVMSRGISVNTTLIIHVGGRMCSTTEKSSSTWTCDFPSLASVLKNSGATCEDSSSQGSVSTADQSICGENICGKTNMDRGIYEVHVITEYRRFLVGCVNLTQMGNRKDDHLSLLLKVGGGALGGVVLLIIMVMCCVMYVKYQKRKFEETFRAQHSITSSNFISSPVAVPSTHINGSAENTYLSLVHLLNPQQDKKKEKDIYHSNLLIQRKNLTLGNVIGNGNFGCVLEGELRGKDREEPLRVAVKTLLDPVTHAIDLQGFIDEALLMKNFNHEHVLGLLGLSEGDRGLPLVVLPFMERGDLLTYVKNESTTLSVGNVMQFACDIASGMDYLSGLKFVHRDLAARNCMLDSELRVKVADFGLCRDIYEKGYYHSDNKKKLPIRWMAIESIEKGTYTSKSDVWSMGIVLWELTTRGITPYPGVEGWDLLRYLMAGRRLEQPLLCSDVLYALMDRCWQEKPIDRPSFKEMENELQALTKTLEQPVSPDAMYLTTLITFPECRRYRMDLLFEAALQPARRQSATAVPMLNELSNEDRPAAEKMADIVKDTAKARPRPAPKLAPKPAPRSKGTKQQSEAGVEDSKSETEEAAHSEPAIELKDVSKKGRKTVRRSDGSYYVLET